MGCGCVGECGALPQSNICISKVIHTALPIKKDCSIVLINGSAAVCVWQCVCGRVGEVACGRGLAPPDHRRAGGFRCCCVALGGKKFDHPGVQRVVC